MEGGHLLVIGGIYYLWEVCSLSYKKTPIFWGFLFNVENRDLKCFDVRLYEGIAKNNNTNCVDVAGSVGFIFLNIGINCSRQAFCTPA